MNFKKPFISVFILLITIFTFLPVKGETSKEALEKGNTLYEQGKYEEAIKCYNKSLRIEPKYGDSWYYKGIALFNQGKYEEAIKCCDTALYISTCEFLLPECKIKSKKIELFRLKIVKLIRDNL